LLEEVVGLLLARHHVVAAGAVDDRAVQQSLGPAALLGRRILHQELQQLLLQALGERRHLLDDLPREILEVLRHHDLVQLALGGAGPLRQRAHEIPAVRREGLELVDAELVAVERVPARPERRRVGAEPLLYRLRDLDRVQRAARGLFGHGDDVGEALARVGYRLRGAAQRLVVAELAQRVVELPREAAHAVQHFRARVVACPRLRAGRGFCRHGRRSGGRGDAVE
jgi:hypothetical protein